MFTGIVEELGVIKQIQRRGKAISLEIGADVILSDIKLGDSISVNGTCLTVTSFGTDSFTADVVPETMERTSLSQIQIGTRVNLERAMAADGRFGGHFVSGHIDGTGTIMKKQRFENAVIVEFEVGEHVLQYVVEKGSVAIDGISLTVMDVTSRGFSVSVIPHTLKETVLQFKAEGDLVNVECDMLGKYVQKFLQKQHRENENTLNRAFLAEHGFLDE